MSASEMQYNMQLQLEAAQEAIAFTKRAKQLSKQKQNGNIDEEGADNNHQHEQEQHIQIMEEMEEMLEDQQKEMKNYQEQISVLTRDLESQRLSNEEKSLIQNRAFDALKQLGNEKAKADDELSELKMRLEEIQNENLNLHQVA